MPPVFTFPRPQMADVVAGISVGLVLIPQSVAYADLAGMPAQIGLFASAFPLIVFSLFASSPYLQSGPTAVSSLLTFSALASTGYGESTEDYVRAGALLALFVGVLRLAMGLLKLGRVAFLVAEPIMIGFTSGAAVVIASTQLQKMLGVTTPEGMTQPLSRAVYALTHVGEWQVLSILVAVVTLVLMLGGKRLHPLFPGVLVAVIMGVIFSKAVDLGNRFNRAVAGDPNEIPGSFPTLQLDLPWGDIFTIFAGGLVIAIVGFAEPSAIARTYANEERQEWDASQEFAASGLANVTSAVFGTYPIGGSFSRSSLNRLAGAQTRWAGAVTGLMVLAALPFAPLLNELPNAVLGAIVIGAVISLLKPKRLMAMWLRSKSLAALSYMTLIFTVVLAPDVYWAIAIGLCLGVVHGLLRPVRVDVSVDGNELTPAGLIWLASNKKFGEALRSAVSNPGTRNNDDPLRLNLANITTVDSDMAEAIAIASLQTSAAGGRLTMINAPEGAEQLIDQNLERLSAGS